MSSGRQVDQTSRTDTRVHPTYEFIQKEQVAHVIPGVNGNKKFLPAYQPNHWTAGCGSRVRESAVHT